MTNDKTTVWNALKPTPKWSVDFQWSQTEAGTATVVAPTREEAHLILKEKLPGICWITGASKIDFEF